MPEGLLGATRGFVPPSCNASQSHIVTQAHAARQRALRSVLALSNVSRVMSLQIIMCASNNTDFNSYVLLVRLF